MRKALLLTEEFILRHFTTTMKWAFNAGCPVYYNADELSEVDHEFAEWMVKVRFSCVGGIEFSYREKDCEDGKYTAEAA